MKAIVLYRIASILLILVAAGNTYSLLRFWQVAGSMNPVLFPLGHTGITYFQVVVTLELFCSLGVLFGAYLAWHLGGLARAIPRAIGTLGWGLFAYELVGVYISFMFLAGPARILAVGIAVCTGCANWLTTTHRQDQQQNEPAAGIGRVPVE
jgi:hypothetical protein